MSPVPAVPGVYFAGPVDYIEHRSPGNHIRDNWRHRFFEDLPINLFCPTCLNTNSKDAKEIMAVNAEAQLAARYFIGFFPGDAATFGTPIEVWTWFEGRRDPSKIALVHPSKPGVFVQTLQGLGLSVLKTHFDARQWLQHQLLYDNG